MNFDYAKDSKEQRPYEHYLNAYKELDPEEISERTGFPYDRENQMFTVKFMGSTYLVSFPDYEIHHVEDGIGVYPLEEAMNAKIFIIRYMAERSKAPATGKFLTYREVPWGEVYFRQFQGRPVSDASGIWLWQQTGSVQKSDDPSGCKTLRNGGLFF